MPQLARIPPANQIQPIDLVAPGFRGLNFSQGGTLLSPQYCTLADNCVLGASGLLSARAGVINLTTTPIGGAPVVRTLFEYRKADGSVETILAYANGISNSVTNPAGSDISGAVSDANGTWRFQNFNDKVIGFQAGQKLIVRTTGNFATVVETTGTAPTGGIGLCAFGRVWQLGADNQTIQYSGLLNETQWNSGGAGSIDMRNIWTQGTDEVTAITSFNGALVVFGRNHIVFWVDGRGSVLGLDPLQLYVVDVISGTGCLSQHTVIPVGATDLLFLSPNGVQSIKRLISERSAPISSLTKYVRDVMLAQLQAETLANIRAAYNPLTGFYILSFPVSGVTWCIDQRRRYRDADGDEASIVTSWTIAPTALVTLRNNNLLLAKTAGTVGQYSGSSDEGVAFKVVYQSPWLDFGEEVANQLKILKRLGAIILVRTQTTITFKWSVDFKTEFDSIQRIVSGDAASEYGIAEFGIGEYSGGLSLRILNLPARGRGQYYRIGIEAAVTGEFALQSAELFTKITRLA